LRRRRRFIRIRGMNPIFGKLISVGVVVIVLVIAASQATFVVEPGFRGVEVTLGKVSPEFKPEGFGTKAPFVTHIVSVPVRQITRALPSETYSADLQQVTINLRVLYRIPEASVVRIYKEYAGDPFDSLIAPRVQEALKEVTALQSAEQIVKKREEIKSRALASSREKIGGLLLIEDLVIEDIVLSKELEAAIESKMVQEQEAAKARFTQQKAQIEADTAIIRAKGEAEAIRIRAEAIRDNPGLIQLQIVEKWDGKAPLVIGGSAEGGAGAANILLSLGTPAAPAARK
jgi:prohibitin 2